MLVGDALKELAWPVKQFVVLFLVSFVALVGLSACAGAGQQLLPGSKQDKNITILGSDTMSSIARQWANAFMTENPGIQVTAESGDTGSGITGLIEGKVDIATASRELTEAENSLAHEKKLRLKRVMVAKDSIAVVVNPVNKLNQISLDELKKVYDGQFTTWDQLTHTKPAEPIRAFGREASSGTGDYFREHILGDAKLGASVKQMTSSEEVIGGVYGNRLAIGFVGMSQAEKARDRVKILKLSLTNGNAKKSGTSEQQLEQDSYPLTRPLYIYYDLKNEAKLGKFLTFMNSKTAEKTISDLGFMPAR